MPTTSASALKLDNFISYILFKRLLFYRDQYCAVVLTEQYENDVNKATKTSTKRQQRNNFIYLKVNRVK